MIEFDTLAYLLMGLICLFGIGALSACAWVAGRCDWLMSRGDGAFLPNMSIGGRYALVGWIWSAAHREIGDARLTRAVLLSRVLSGGTGMSMVALVALGQFGH